MNQTVSFPHRLIRKETVGYARLGEGGNIYDLYAVAVVKNNDTLIDNDAYALNGKFRS